jgi:hypothetical protein
LRAIWTAVGPLVGVVVGALLGYFGRRSEQAFARRSRWSDRAAKALADVKLLLTDSHPHRVTLNMNRETVWTEVLALQNRGIPIRRALAEVGAGHPDPSIRSTADELEVAIFSADVSLRWVVSDMLRHVDVVTSLPRAMNDYERAERLRIEIIDRLHARGVLRPRRLRTTERRRDALQDVDPA